MTTDTLFSPRCAYTVAFGPDAATRGQHATIPAR